MLLLQRPNCVQQQRTAHVLKAIDFPLGNNAYYVRNVSERTMTWFHKMGIHVCINVSDMPNQQPRIPRPTSWQWYAMAGGESRHGAHNGLKRNETVNSTLRQYSREG